MLGAHGQKRPQVAVLAMLAAFMASSGALGPVHAADTAAGAHSADDAAIRAQAREYAQDFAAAATDKLTDLWDESAIFIDQDGNVFRGRDQIRKQYASFFAQNGAQPLDVVVESVEFPAENIAVEEGITRLMNSGSPSSTVRYVATHVKKDGKWQMQNVTESPYKAENLGEYLKPLSWFLGRWKAEGPNGALTMKADWANNNVIALNVEAVPKDSAAKSVHSEFIYWDPRSRCISSWQFDDGGGTSHKRWEHVGDNWIVHAMSVQADGSESSAEYLFKPLDHDSFSWQSRHRSLDGVALPDTEQIKVTRVKS